MFGVRRIGLDWGCLNAVGATPATSPGLLGCVASGVGGGCLVDLTDRLQGVDDGNGKVC